MKQSRWKSWVLWSAIVAQVIAICQMSGVFVKLGIDAGNVGDVVAGVLQLLVVMGILNDPTASNAF